MNKPSESEPKPTEPEPKPTRLEGKRCFGPTFH
ncbi:hypothetical protein ABIC06_005221 [Bradyrhizobium sp. RT7b]